MLYTTKTKVSDGGGQKIYSGVAGDGEGSVDAEQKESCCATTETLAAQEGVSGCD